MLDFKGLHSEAFVVSGSGDGFDSAVDKCLERLHSAIEFTDTGMLTGLLFRLAAIPSRRKFGQVALKHFAGEIGQTRALATRKGNVPTMRPALEAVDGKCHA